MMTRLLMTLCALVMLLSTASCAPPLLIAGAGATGAAVVSDRRTARVVVEDQIIEAEAADAINDDLLLSDGVHVSVTSYNHVVLLTGQAPDQAAVDRIVQHVRGVDKVRSIHNHVDIGPATSFGQRSRDTLTTARVKSTLLGEEGLSSMQVKVVTESDSVYLMGMIRRSDAGRVAEVVQQQDGVRRVVLVFEYIR
jgi:osmotically-inducible protein OsmY